MSERSFFEDLSSKVKVHFVRFFCIEEKVCFEMVIYQLALCY